MTKGNLVATSFVGAIPAGFLAFFSIKAFLDFSENMATMLQVVNGTTVLFSVLMALSPLAVLIFVRSPAAADESAAASSPAALPAAASPALVDDEELAVDDGEFAVEADGEFGEPASGTDEDDMSLSGFDDSLDPTSGASDDAFEFDDSEFELGDDEFK